MTLEERYLGEVKAYEPHVFVNDKLTLGEKVEQPSEIRLFPVLSSDRSVIPITVLDLYEASSQVRAAVYLTETELLELITALTNAYHNHKALREKRY